MKPGREFDAFVAEKVMGLTVKVWDHDTGSSYVVIKDMDKPECSEFVPSYSTDISAAWEVVEKLKSSGWSFLLGIESVVWRARFYKEDDGVVVPAQTAQHAICLAAKAVWERKLISPGAT